MKITKTGVIISLITLTTIVVALGYFIRPQGTVDFALAPSEITMTIDNKQQTVQHKQTLNLTPGTYAATFSSEGFKSKKKTIIVEDNKKLRLVMALTPLTDAARKKINDNPESLAVVNEYKKVRYDELLATLPLTGVNYEMIRCPSVKNPESDINAICITVNSAAGKAAALAALRQLDHNPDDMELLIGNKTQKLLFESDSYRIDYYTNVNQEDSDKIGLFITPLNVPYVPYGAPVNSQLETIKAEALKTLETNGYNLETYDIFYSNPYLSQYNANVNRPDGHAVAPAN